MPRPCKCRRIAGSPRTRYFKPTGIPLYELEEISLPEDGLEAIRLADLEGLSMENAATQMGVSRHTFGRILNRAHSAVAQALVGGHALRIEGGHCALADSELPLSD